MRMNLEVPGKGFAALPIDVPYGIVNAILCEDHPGQQISILLSFLPMCGVPSNVLNKLAWMMDQTFKAGGRCVFA